MSHPQRSQKMSKSTSERVYEKLLAACPKEFREDHGPHMMQSFGDLRKEERYRGRLGRTRLWRRTLPDLALTAISERSKMMGHAALWAGRLLSLRTLMTINAICLILFGLAAIYAGPVIADLYELWANVGSAFVRFSGVMCLGFGAILAILAPLAEYRAKTICGTLLAVYGFGSFLMLIQQTEIWLSTIGQITVALHLLFAVGYGLFLVTDVVAKWHSS